MASVYSLYDVRRMYDSLRRKHFSAVVEPARAVPLAKDIRWYWLAKNSDALGITHWDEDGDPDAVGLAPMLRGSHHLMKHIVLHEMTHIRLGPDVSCGGFSHAWTGPRIARSGVWHAETVRLVADGAFQL